MNTQYTTGPWVGQDQQGKFNSAHDWSVTNDEHMTSEAAPIWADGRVIAFAVYSADTLYAGSQPSVKADARLIAAAPDLLEAVQAAWDCIGELPPTQARVEVAQLLQAAIEKAVGAQP